MPVSIRPAALPTWPIAALLGATTVATAHGAFVAGLIPDLAKLTSVGLDLLALVIALTVMRRNFTVGFLLSLLPFMISWRVSAIFGAVPAMTAATVTLGYYLLVYFDAMRADWHNAEEGWFGKLQWQMTTLRIYFGFDMVGHLTEKLAAGTHSFHYMSEQFLTFGVPNGALFVILSGLCELGIAIGIGTGLLTRLAGFCAALYYMIANQYGGHFENGFTWSNRPDGGWEFPVLMAFFYISFTLSGAGKFSIDGWLIERGLMPRVLLPLCRSGG